MAYAFGALIGLFALFLVKVVGLSFGAAILIFIGFYCVLIVGIAVAKHKKSNTKNCVSCAEKIQPTAKKCRFCNEPQPEIGS